MAVEVAVIDYLERPHRHFLAAGDVGHLLTLGSQHAIGDNGHAMHLVLNFLAATFAGGIRTYVIILTSSRSAVIEDTEVVADGMLPFRGFLLLHHGQAVQHVLASK